MNVKITIPCPFCNGETTFIIPTEEYDAYKKSGDTKVFTTLSDDQIETLSTGTCDRCIGKSDSQSESDGCECSDDECCCSDGCECDSSECDEDFDDFEDFSKETDDDAADEDFDDFDDAEDDEDFNDEDADEDFSEFDDTEDNELEESVNQDEDATLDVYDTKEKRICDIIMGVWRKLTGKSEFTGDDLDWEMLGVATVEAQERGLLTEAYPSHEIGGVTDAPTVDVEDDFCERVGNEIKGAWQRISKHFKWNGSETDKAALDDAITKVSLNLKNSKNVNNWEDSDSNDDEFFEDDMK